jgi:tRNA-dihydrouridine synthase B
MRLGSLQLAGRVILSPMESVSDHAFRKLCYSQGAALCWTEMIRAAAVCKNNLATLELIDTFDANVPTGVQLMVRGADETLKCLHKIESFANGIDKKYIEHIGGDGTITKELRNFDHFKNIRAIDINLGCPSPEVIKGGAGPALLKRTRKLKEIFDVLVKWKETNSLGSVGAVGCKIRLGLNHVEQSNKVYMQVVELARDAGLDYICIHARHAEQVIRFLSNAIITFKDRISMNFESNHIYLFSLLNAL